MEVLNTFLNNPTFPLSLEEILTIPVSCTKPNLSDFTSFPYELSTSDSSHIKTNLTLTPALQTLNKSLTIDIEPPVSKLTLSSSQASREVISIVSWNIAGWTSKPLDSDFIKFCSSFDVILFQETWSIKPTLPSLPGYTSLTNPATKVSANGRARGGLATLISNNKFHKYEVLDISNSSNLMVSCVTHTSSFKFLLLNIYCPPLDPLRLGSPMFLELNQALSILYEKYPDTRILIAGDMNARLGPNNTNIGNSLGLSSEDLLFLPNRVSPDLVVNPAGRALFSLIFKFHLFICNGSTTDLDASSFTFYGPRGNSVIDFMLLSFPLSTYFRSFKVLCRPESDHMPISLTLCLPPGHNPITNKQRVPTPPYCLRRLPWNEKIQNQVLLLLDSPNMLALRDSVSDTSNPLDTFNEITAAIKPLLVSSKPPKYDSSSAGGWFDKDCLIQKRVLLTALRRFRKWGSTANYYAFTRLRRDYKNLLRRKKDEHTKKSWQALSSAALHKEPAKFWALVNRGMKSSFEPLDHQISSSQWHQHFSAIYREKDYTNSLTHLLELNVPSLHLLPEWDPVSKEELNELITAIANNKAPGPDMLPGELFKCNPDWWSDVLSKVFSFINHSGEFPPVWLDSIVSPIHKKRIQTGPKKLPSHKSSLCGFQTIHEVPAP